MGLFSAPAVQFFLIQYELFLAVWLLSGKFALKAWWTALLTFFAFAAVSGYQGWIGRTSCGCFGRVMLNPWYAFALDIAVLTALLFARPQQIPAPDVSSSRAQNALRPITWAVAGIIAVSGVFVGIAFIGFGSIPAAIAHFRGEPVSMLPRTLNLGVCVPGSSQDIVIEVKNWTDKSIRLVGGTADCSCTVLHDLPALIPAKESKSVSVQMRVPTKPGTFVRTASFLVDVDGSSKRVGFRITGTIRKPTETTARNKEGYVAQSRTSLEVERSCGWHD